jgi:hypothetical protein
MGRREVTGRVRPAPLLVWVAVLLARAAAVSAEGAGDGVEVRIDTVLASHSGHAFDSALISLQQPFRSLFPYSSYRLVQGERRLVGWKREEQFLLPGGRYLVVVPRGIQNDRVSLNVMLIQGTRPLVNTVLSLKNHGTFLVGGPQYGGGVLIIAIGAGTPAASGTVRTVAIER